MNGLSSPALHVGAYVAFSLAGSYLRCDWPGSLRSVGGSYRWWKWDIWRLGSWSIFHRSRRGSEKPTQRRASFYRLCEALQLTEVALSFLTHPKNRVEYFVLLFQISFCSFKGTACVNKRSWHFPADILAFCLESVHVAFRNNLFCTLWGKSSQITQR